MIIPLCRCGEVRGTHVLSLQPSLAATISHARCWGEPALCLALWWDLLHILR